MFEAEDGLFAPDTFFDLLPPFWRFQLVGSGADFSSQLRSIAEVKMPDLNARDVDEAVKVIAGTARSMGVETDV